MPRISAKRLNFLCALGIAYPLVSGAAQVMPIPSGASGSATQLKSDWSRVGLPAWHFGQRGSIGS